MAGAPDRFGPFTFDRVSGTLTRDGKHLTLGGRASALLGALVAAHGAAVGKDALIEAAWPGTIVEEGNLSVQIAALRKALGRREDGQEWITTVPRIGYRLPRAETAAPRTPASGRASIAVLPFANLSADPEQAFLADGVVEDLITALSRFHTFAVVSRTSSFAYKNRAVDVREVARELGVRYVLEGSVRRSGERVRVAAQLVEGGTGAHLWAESFDGSIGDIFDFQDRITRSVIGLVEPQIRRAEIDRARRKPPEHIDAWDLYVQALPLVYSSDHANHTVAIDLLAKAIAIDSNYAPALALKSWAHEKRKTLGGVAPPGTDDVVESLALAERALAADPDDAVAIALLGWLKLIFRNDATGTQLARRAVQLNPNNVIVLNFATVTNNFGGDLDEAIASATRALELSPGAPDTYVCLHDIAVANFLARRYEEALAWERRSIEVNDSYVYSHLVAAMAHAFLDRVPEARAEKDKVLKMWPVLSVEYWLRTYPTPTNARVDAWIAGLRKAGIPER